MDVMMTSRTMDWFGLVESRDAWIAHNFPNSDKTDTILGVVEEYGEFTHAYLKQKQAIRGTAEQHDEDMKDAIGDMTVYLLGVMSYSGQYPGMVQPRQLLTTIDECIFALSGPVDRICELQFRPQVRAPITRLIEVLERICAIKGWSFADIVTDTWAGVSQRDWIKYPGDGKTH